MPLSLSPVIAGTPFDIGVRLGELARPVFDAYMQQRSAWQAVRRWRGHPFVAALRQAALAAYPDLVAERDGIAASVARCSVVDVAHLSGHANHLVHPGCDAQAQIVTQSSADRQRRVDALTRGIDTIDAAALLRVLGDRAPEGLPIHRDDPADPADPDDENTLATAVCAIGAASIDFTVHQHGTQRFATRIVPSGRAHRAS
ncbi:MAG: carcinine hydrolase/isopenicillin-N N-acyltransferase family protein [Burkholderia cenocepacia]